MKKFTVTSVIFLITVFVTISILLYLQRDSRPTVFCSSFDDTIRPRNYCLMNPFRERESEKSAETVLRELKNGNTQAIVPYLNDWNEDERNRFLENEKKFQIENWRIGARKDSQDEISLMYWVSRKNYHFDGDGGPHLEEVGFYFVREGNNLILKKFSAIY